MLDKNEILPTEDLVTPERLAKGDLEVAYNSRGKISRAIPVNYTIVKELIRRDIFPYYYGAYGDSFLELREIFHAPWRAKLSSVLLEQWGIGLSHTKAGDIYQNVCRGLGPRRVDTIVFLLEEVKEKENRTKHDFYKECFELLTVLMDEEREKIFALIKK